MRWIFFTLLATNIGIFAYTQWLNYQPIVDTETAVVLEPRIESAPLVLLSELNAQNVTIDSVRIKTSEQPTESPASTSRSICTLVGAFADVAKAERFVERLSAFGVNAKLKNLLVSSTVGYWLHLPPQSSRKEVLRRLSELQRQGVDSYIIPDGDLANGISLGMFSEEKRANELKKSISLLGYQPEILSVPRERRELWVLLSQPEAVKISAERWLKLISGKDLLQKQQNLCSDVASA